MEGTDMAGRLAGPLPPFSVNCISTAVWLLTSVNVILITFYSTPTRVACFVPGPESSVLVRNVWVKVTERRETNIIRTDFVRAEATIELFFVTWYLEPS